MPTCPQCGTTEPDGAQWCGKCYLPFTPTASSQGFTGVVMPDTAPAAAVPAAPPPAAPPVMAAPAMTPVHMAPPPPMAPPPIAPPPIAPPPMAPPSVPPPPMCAPPMAAPAADTAGWGAPVGAPVMAGGDAPPPPGWGQAAPLQRVGWQPPGGAYPGGVPPAAVSDPAAEGRLLSGRALVVVIVSIALGAAYQGIVKLLERDPHISIQSVLRYNIVLNVLVYAIVGGLVLSQVTPNIRLRWGEGSRLTRVAFGAAFGLTGGALAVAAVSGAAHHLSTDPRAIQMLSGGDPAHVLITILLVCIAAPLVEETLFRGLLLESLRHYQLRMAVIVSAMFFAVWHLNKQALVYYTAMGCIFAGLYVKRGLVASMTAHACFNGVLTLAGLAIVFGPSHLFEVGHLQVEVPSGWASVSPYDVFGPGEAPVGADQMLLLEGPDGAQMAIIDGGAPLQPFNSTALKQRIEQNFSSLDLPEGLVYTPGSIREVMLPTVGPAVEFDVTLHSSRSQYAYFAYGGDIYVVFVETGDSAKARGDFTKMLESLQPVPGVVPAS